MTESEWLSCEDPNPMLAFLHGKASARKLRLFACACCREVIWHLLDERSREAVAVAERFADGRAREMELEMARQLAADVVAAELHGTKTYHAAYAAQAAARTDWSAEVLAGHAAFGAYASGERKLIGIERRSKTVRDRHKAARLIVLAHKAKEAALLRDLFGNPFRPILFDPALQTPAVVALAQAIDNERAFDSLPVLADALDHAGCTNTDMLAHCRQQWGHVRGCWVVDLLLGKN